jgi:DNA-binding NtrC family response regulator
LEEESEALRILSIEDDPLSAELIQSTLLEGGIDCELTQVQTGDDFAAALGKGGFDLILSDYWLPSFDALSALKMAREAYPEVPFILVSEAIGEERAIKALKSGATDYVLKHHLERLVPTVRRAIREAKKRSERRWAKEAIGANEEQFRATFEQGAFGIAHTALDGSWLKVNQRL